MRSIGRFRSEDIGHLNQANAETDLFHQGAPVVHDMRSVDFDVDTAEIMVMRRFPIHMPGSETTRRVAVIADTTLAFGMLRMLTQLREAEGREVRAFRAFHEAFEWVGRPELGESLPPDIDAALARHLEEDDDPDDGFRVFVHNL